VMMCQRVLTKVADQALEGAGLVTDHGAARHLGSSASVLLPVAFDFEVKVSP